LLLLASVAVAAAGCSMSSPGTAQEDARVHEVRAAAAQKAAVAEGAFDEAMMLVAEQRYTEALKKLTPLAATFEAAEDRPRAARVTFWMAYCHEKQGRQPEAIAMYERVQRTYPQTPACRLAAARIANLRGPPK
jgi:TolA-binding protein